MGVKISELSAPTLPLTGTELIEMSQSGVSVQVTVDDLPLGGGILSIDGTTLTVLGDIVANDLTLSGDTLYLGNAQLKSSGVSGDLDLPATDAINVWTQGSTGSGAVINLYGDDSNAGGQVRLYLGNSYNGTITYFQIEGQNDDLQIGPNTNVDSLKYDGTLNRWQASATGGFSIGDPTNANGAQLYIGVNDNITSEYGQIYLYAGTTVDGGKVQFYTGTSYDTTIDYYHVRAYRDDLNIGPSSHWDAMVYDGGTNAWWMQATGGVRIGDQTTASGSQLYIGVNDVGQQASLYLYGGNSQPGGSVYFYVGEPYDATIDYFLISPNEDDFQIGPATDTDALKYDGGANSWQMQASGGLYIGDRTTAAGSTLHIGINDSPTSTFGIINVYAGTTQDGGTLKLYVGSSYDTTIDFYYIRAFDDDLAIGPSTDYDSLKYDGGLGTWNFTGSNGVNIGVDDSVQGLLNIFGSSNSTDGGRIRVYSPADSDTQDYYEIFADGGPLTIRNSSGQEYLGCGSGGLTSLGHTASPIYLNGSDVRVSSGILHVGTEDIDAGIIHAYGDIADDGGELRIYTPGNYDANINYYSIMVDSTSANLIIGPDTNPDALKFDADAQWWEMQGELIASGVQVGEEDVIGGSLTLYATAASSGGEIIIHTPGNYDDTIATYEIRTVQDNFTIGPDTDADALKYNGGTGSWEMAHNGSLVMSTDTTGIVVVGSVRADDLIVNGSTIYLGNTVLSEGAGGTLVVSGGLESDQPSSIYYDNTTTTPAWIFDVESNPTLGGGDNAIFNGIRSYYHPDFSAGIADMRNSYAGQFRVVIDDDNQTFDVTGSGQTMVGVYSGISVTNSHSNWNTMKGIECVTAVNNESGVGTIGDVYGIDNTVSIRSAYGGAVGSWYGINNSSTFEARSAADTPVWGIYNFLNLNGTFGGTNDAKGIEIDLNATIASTVTGNFYGLHIQDDGCANLTVNGDYYGIRVDADAVGTVSGGEAYGLYIDPPDMAGTNYGIYVNSGHDTGLYINQSSGSKGIELKMISAATGGLDTYGLDIDITHDPGDGDSYSLYGGSIVASMGGSSSPAPGNVTGLLVTANTEDTVVSNGTILGINASASANGNQTGVLRGANFAASVNSGTASAVTGVDIVFSNSGTISNDLIGLNITGSSEESTISGDLYGAKIDTSGIADTPAGGQNYGLYVKIPNLATDYGIYVDVSSGADYGIYSAGSGSLNQFEGSVRVGVDDSVQGKLILYGAESGPGGGDGGYARFHCGADYDGTIEYYEIRAQNDDFYLGPSTDSDALKYDGGTNQWQMSASGGVSITGDLDVSGDVTAANTDSPKIDDSISAFGTVDLGDTDFDGSTVILDGTGNITIQNWTPTLGKLYHVATPYITGGQTITVLLSSGITFDGNSDQLIFDGANECITLQMITADRVLVLNNFNGVDYTSGGA